MPTMGTATRTVSENFELEDVAFIKGGSMDESGKCQITKRWIYNIVDNSAAKRRRALLDLETLVPVKGSCMADDARYTLKSAQWNCYNWDAQEKKFYIDAVYRRVSDDDEASAPWNLAPFNVRITGLEQVEPFRLAYNGKNKRCLPVVNTAGDPLDASTSNNLIEYNFSFYSENYDEDNVDEYFNSINKNKQRLLGTNHAAGTLLITNFNVLPQITYEDDGYTEKWRYYQVDLTIRANKKGWDQELLNVGNRARFGDSKAPETIYQVYELDETTKRFKTKPSWVNAAAYYAMAKKYSDWYVGQDAAVVANMPRTLPYEYGENIPLDSTGKVYTEILDQDIARGDFSSYPTRKFQQYESLSWSGLSLPEDVKKRWRSA